MAVSKVYVEDNQVKVIDNMEDAVEATLLGCAAELVSQTIRNSRVDSGKTKGSWKSYVTRTGNGFIAYIGSPDENAIWEEFGTGEHAITENGGKGGRKSPWYVPAEKVTGKKKPTYNGKVILIHGTDGRDFYKTNGKKPTRAFWNAYTKLEKKILARIQNAFKGL